MRKSPQERKTEYDIETDDYRNLKMSGDDDGIVIRSIMEDTQHIRIPGEAVDQVAEIITAWQAARDDGGDDDD